MDWQQKVIFLIEDYFKKYGINYNHSNNPHRCIIDYLNFKSKIVSQTPRTVFLSQEVKKSLLVNDIQTLQSFNFIVDKIQNGQDLKFHQSKTTLDPKFNDLLFNDWIIHHFHLSDKNSKPWQPFYDRSNFLLFAIFSPNQAFLVDIRNHNEIDIWSKKEFLEIIDRNWPSMLKTNEHEYAKLLSSSYSDKDIGILRRKGYALGTTVVNGKIVINPGIGITTSGHNLLIVKQANDVIRHLYETMSEIESNLDAVKIYLSNSTGKTINSLDLTIARTDHWPHFTVYEKSSGYHLHKQYH